MTRNAPDFDPLNCTAAEEDEMTRGYLDGHQGRPPPRVTSIAYDHGRRNGTNDRARVVDPEQLESARRLVARQCRPAARPPAGGPS